MPHRSHHPDRPAPHAGAGRRWRRTGLASVLATVVAIATIWMLGTSRASAQTVSLLPDSEVPTVLTDPDNRAVELGLRFRALSAVDAVAVQVYETAANPAPLHATLWSAHGRALAHATLTGTARTGLQTFALDRRVALRAGRSYVVSYTAPKGHYPVTEHYFVNPVSNGPLQADRDAGVYTYSPGAFPRSTYQGSNYGVDVVVETTGAGAPPPTPTQSAPPSTTPSTTTSPGPSHTASPSPSSTSTTPTGTTTPSRTATPSSTPSPTSTATSAAGGFPDAASTGVPAGVQLTPYTGPCTITTAGTVIDAKTVNCALSIRAANVVIRNSVINGTVANDDASNGLGFTITDSEVRIGDHADTGIGTVGFTALRVEVTGGNRSINCWRDCTVRDSWVHGQFTDRSGVSHESGIRMGSGGTIRHNTITCDAPDVPPDAGCSADLTGYGDFAPVEHNLIENNLLTLTTGGACAYGGSSAGKPYSDDANNIRFIDNVFQRTAARPHCGTWFPIASFDSSAPGNVWSGNVWSDGGVVPPA